MIPNIDVGTKVSAAVTGRVYRYRLNSDGAWLQLDVSNNGDGSLAPVLVEVLADAVGTGVDYAVLDQAPYYNAGMDIPYPAFIERLSRSSVVQVVGFPLVSSNGFFVVTNTDQFMEPGGTEPYSSAQLFTARGYVRLIYQPAEE